MVVSAPAGTGILTVGDEGRNLGELVGLLRRHDVEVLTDRATEVHPDLEVVHL